MSLDTGSLIDILTSRRWDAHELWRQAQARASRNRRLGLQPGDRALLLASNTLEFFAELFAVWMAGAAAIPADSSLSAFELDNLLAASEARLTVRTDSQPVRWEPAHGIVDGTICPEAEPEAAPHAGAQFRLDDDALILFTSGSTGQPKGVVHTHRSLLAQWTRLRQALGVETYQRTLCLLPVFFGHGLICNALFPLVSGCDVYLGPAFTPAMLASLAATIDEHGITAMSSVPALWRLALRLSGSPRGGTLRRVHCGSAPLSADLWQRIRDWSGGAEVVNTYGITETASWLGGSLGEAPRDGLIGRAWGGEIRVLRTGQALEGLSADSECAAGETGYVWARTPALMKGYYRRDDLTAAVVRAGWFYTGDVGYRDEAGLVFLSGRAVEEINKGGLKIQPQDVENVAASCPWVRDVCVFAVADELYGQNVAIALALDPERTEGLRELHAWMTERLSRHKMPAAWYLLESLPRTARGKIQRSSVAALCAARQPVDTRAFL